MRFVQLIAMKNLPEANKMLSKHGTRSRIGHQVGDLNHWTKMQLQSGSRTTRDLYLGRSSFQMVDGNFNLIVERFRVILPDDEYFVWVGPDEWISLRSDGISFVDTHAIASRSTR